MKHVHTSLFVGMELHLHLRNHDMLEPLRYSSEDDGIDYSEEDLRGMGVYKEDGKYYYYPHVKATTSSNVRYMWVFNKQKDAEAFYDTLLYKRFKGFVSVWEEGMPFIGSFHSENEKITENLELIPDLV